MVDMNNPLGPATLTDRILTVRQGTPNSYGDVSAQELVDLAKDEISPSDLININDTDDLTPFLSGGEYVIPAGRGFNFIKNIVLNFPIRLPFIGDYPNPALAFTSIIAPYISGTGFIQLSYTGSGSFIRGVASPGLFLENLNIIQAGPSAQVFDIQNGPNPAAWAPGQFWNNVFFTNWTDCGLNEGFNLAALTRFAFIGCGNGVQFRNFASLGLQVVSAAQGQNLPDTRYIQLSGIMQRFSFPGPAAGVLADNESLLKIDTDILAERLTVKNLSVTGGGRLYHTAGLDQDSPLLLSLSNPPFPDSKTVLFSTANTTPALTTINTVNTFETIELNSPGYTNTLIKRFFPVESVPGSGIFNTFVYQGVQTIDVSIHAVLSGRAAAGTITGRAAIEQDGIVIPETGVASVLITGSPVSLNTKGIITLKAAINGTYSQSGTVVTITLDNTDLDGNIIHNVGESQYINVLSSTATSGIYEITGANATSITYTANDSQTASGQCTTNDIIRLVIENETNATDIFTQDLNIEIIP